MKKLIAVLLALMMLAAVASAEGLMVGGWTAAGDPAVTEEVRALFDKAIEGLVGVNYVPVAYLGSQVVAGTNHAILCQGTVVYPGAEPSWKIIYLYEDLQGNVSIMNIADFDFGALCTYGAAEAADSGMSHADYVAAELETPVTVETYVQAHQSWWENKVTVYAQSEDGAYFIYNMECSEEDVEKLVPGTKIRVSGYKSEWAGEVEIIDATFEFIDGEPFIAEAEDVTAKLGTDEMIDCQNELVCFKGMTVEAYDESGAAFAYKNAENKTDDLYFRVSKDGQTYDFCVEFYLCGQDTEVYKAVEALNVGDVIDIEGFLYWYNGMNPHTVRIAPAE